MFAIPDVDTEIPLEKRKNALEKMCEMISVILVLWRSLNASDTACFVYCVIW